jgi:hypothetical protein
VLVDLKALLLSWPDIASAQVKSHRFEEKSEKMNKPEYPTPLPARIGETVKCPPPKGATPGTPTAYGTIIDYVAANPAWTDDWGWYFYIVEIIKWQNSDLTARFGYWSFPPHGKTSGKRKGWKWGQYGPEDRLPVMLSLMEKGQQLIRKHPAPSDS